MLINGKKLMNLPVYTQSGDRLGEVDDLELETEGQTIINYLVGSKGMIKGLFGNKLVIHRSEVISISEEKIVVDNNVAEKVTQLAEAKNDKDIQVSEGVVASIDKN